MIADLGQLALILAFLAALTQAGLVLEGTRRGLRALVEAGGHAAIACALLVLLSAGLRVASFSLNDFTVAAVAAHSHPSLSQAGRVAAAWSDGAGGLMLLAAALSVGNLSLRLASLGLSVAHSTRALGVLGLVASALLAVTLIGASPFARVSPASLPGPGTGNFLQDPAVLLQAPLLAVGMAGFAIVFALGWVAVRDDRLGANWARDLRPWSLGAWVFLSAGMAVGMVWAERAEALGGRWWSWEPPQAVLAAVWLASTALLHVLSVAEKRGHFLREAAMLALVPFPLALLGGWLVREGLYPAAPWPAPDPGLGRAYLLLFAATAGLGLAALHRRARAVPASAPFEMISREAVLAASAVLLLAALAAVLIGLLQPLAAGPLGLVRGVGASYFDAVFVPLVVPALALMGPGPRLHWSSEAAGVAWRDAMRPAAAGSAIVAASMLLWERAGTREVASLFLSTWIAWHAIESIVLRRRRPADAFELQAAPGAASCFYATHAAHFGIALVVAGGALSGGLEQSAELPIIAGADQSAGYLRLRTEGAREFRDEGTRTVRFRVWVREEGRETLLEPELRFPAAGGPPARVTAVDRGLARDLHVSPRAPAGTGGWTLRVQVRPFMSLVWFGIVLTVAGGVLALAGRAHQVLRSKDGIAPAAPGELALRSAS